MGFWGAPLADDNSEYLAESASRAITTTTKLKLIAKSHPLETLCLLRYCAGACKVDHLCRAVPASKLTDVLLTPVGDGMRSVMEEMLGCSIDETTWTQITLPLDMGGLALRDPRHSATAAHLANMINVMSVPSQKNWEQGVPTSSVYKPWPFPNILLHSELLLLRNRSQAAPNFSTL